MKKLHTFLAYVQIHTIRPRTCTCERFQVNHSSGIQIMDTFSLNEMLANAEPNE